jgi:hypothetical protein
MSAALDKFVIVLLVEFYEILRLSECRMKYKDFSFLKEKHLKIFKTCDNPY